MTTPSTPKAPAPKRVYEPPRLVALGNLKDLTGKHLSGGDGKAGGQGLVK